MSQPRMRPEFTRPLPGPAADFLAALGAALREPAGAARGQTFAGGAILRLRDGHERLWSPALHLHIEEEAGAPLLRGRFSPSSPVWTAFVAIYLVLAIAAIGAGCYGGAQLILGEAPWAFWGVPVAVVLAGFVYGAAFIGQGLGAEDMYELRSVVDRIADGCPAATSLR
ncbi:MAG: hypothetical protein H6838_14425 [Planctomycetes bacterium]|nr:hypothetical protein [Planctomycetota bacterium]MCB9886686.1 hypothetical protein [Planctomycetota bacterium]